jgi:hypothetical protein
MRRRPLALLLPAVLLAGSGCAVRLRQPETAPPVEEVPRIPAEQAHAEVEAGRALLIDVRGDQPFQLRRAGGAVSIPLEQIEASPAAALRLLPADKRPVLYCT